MRHLLGERRVERIGELGDLVEGDRESARLVGVEPALGHCRVEIVDERVHRRERAGERRDRHLEVIERPERGVDVGECGGAPAARDRIVLACGLAGNTHEERREPAVDDAERVAARARHRMRDREGQAGGAEPPQELVLEALPRRLRDVRVHAEDEVAGRA